MQCAVIEFARNVLGLADANSSEMESTPHPVIDLMPDQKDVRSKGATMRLGAYPCIIQPDTLMAKCYGKTEIQERHRHRYEYQNQYRETLENAGLICSGISPDGNLVEAVEWKDHPFFIGVQYHPEFKSRPNRPHSLFQGFLAAALEGEKND